MRKRLLIPLFLLIPGLGGAEPAATGPGPKEIIEKNISELRTHVSFEPFLKQETAEEEVRTVKKLIKDAVAIAKETGEWGTLVLSLDEAIRANRTFAFYDAYAMEYLGKIDEFLPLAKVIDMQRLAEALIAKVEAREEFYKVVSSKDLRFLNCWYAIELTAMLTGYADVGKIHGKGEGEINWGAFPALVAHVKSRSKVAPK